nr:c-type cytochrome [uncultured Pseudomonas sp.]
MRNRSIDPHIPRRWLRSLLLVIALTTLTACDDDLLVVPGVGVGYDEAGREAFNQYACTSCHVIPGVVGSDIHVGPPLTAIAQRKFIAGVLPNNPENLVRWLREPQKFAPRSAMPDLGVSEQSALDMTAYLYGRTADD